MVEPEPCQMWSGKKEVHQPDIHGRDLRVFTCPAGQTLTHSHYVRKFSRGIYKRRASCERGDLAGENKTLSPPQTVQWPPSFILLFYSPVTLQYQRLLMSPPDSRCSISIYFGAPVLP